MTANTKLLRVGFAILVVTLLLCFGLNQMFGADAPVTPAPILLVTDAERAARSYDIASGQALFLAKVFPEQPGHRFFERRAEVFMRAADAIRKAEKDLNYELSLVQDLVTPLPLSSASNVAPSNTQTKHE